MMYLDNDLCHPQAILSPISLIFDFSYAERRLAAAAVLEDFLRVAQLCQLLNL